MLRRGEFSAKSTLIYAAAVLYIQYNNNIIYTHAYIYRALSGLRWGSLGEGNRAGGGLTDCHISRANAAGVGGASVRRESGSGGFIIDGGPRKYTAAECSADATTLRGWFSPPPTARM